MLLSFTNGLHVHQETCSRISTAIWFGTVKLKAAQCPSARVWIDKSGYIHEWRWENEPLHEAIQMNLTTILLSKRSYIEESRLYKSIYVYISKVDKSKV